MALILLLAVLAIIIALIIRSRNNRRSPMAFNNRSIKEFQKARRREERRRRATTEPVLEARLEPERFNSFYVADDGTIVRGHHSDSESEHNSIVQSPIEQKEALSLIKESAEAGYAEAQYFLGLCYEQGTVVAKNLEMAKTWYEKASSQGFPQAKYRLGRLLMSKEMQ